MGVICNSSRYFELKDILSNIYTHEAVSIASFWTEKCLVAEATINFRVGRADSRLRFYLLKGILVPVIYNEAARSADHFSPEQQEGS